MVDFLDAQTMEVLGSNRSIIPLDVLGHMCTLVISRLEVMYFGCGFFSYVAEFPSFRF